MSIDDDKPAVAPDADGSPGEGPEDKGAQVDDLDAALDEFAQATAKEEKPEDKTADKPDEASDDRDARLDRIENRFVSEDLGKAVTSIKEAHDNLEGVSKDMIEGRLRLESSRDPRVEQAFLNQANDPAGWDKVLKSLGDKIAKEVGAQADPQLTNDRDAMRSAVKKQSTNAPAGPSHEEVRNMSDAEFDAHTEQGFRGTA